MPDVMERGKKECPMDIVWLRWNIITIDDLRNIAEVICLNILDVTTAPTPSPLPVRISE